MLRARVAVALLVLAVVAAVAPIPSTAPVSAATDTYVPVMPTRFLDTRAAGQAPLGPGEIRTVPITGRAGIPAEAVAVALNVTAVAPTVGGFLTVYPAGTPLPGSSNLNFGPAQTAPNMVVVGIGASGQVSIYNAAGTTHVLVDVAGWYTGGFHPIAPARFLDTRLASQVALRPGEVRTVQITGRAGIPATVVAVAVNVTVVSSTASGYLSVYPSGTPTPRASSVNFVPGQVVPNLVLVGVGAGGRISIFNPNGSTPVIADVEGWFSSGFDPVTPSRLADTRAGQCGVRLGQGDRRSIVVLGRDGLPAAGVSAVALNVTVTNESSGGFVTVYPKGNPLPEASNLNFSRFQNTANLVLVGLGDDGAISIFNASGTADVIVDVTGWFPGASSASPLFDCAVLPAPPPRAPSGITLPPGTWALGTIPDGRWLAPGGAACRWARVAGFSGAPGEVLGAGGGEPRPIVDVLASDAGFSSVACGAWSAYAPPATPAVVVGDGDWVISEDMLPGVYQSSGAGPCRWEELMGFTGTAADSIDDGVATGIAFVELAPWEVGFRSQGCGSWRWVAPPTA